MSEELMRTLGRMENKLDMVVEDHAEMKRDVAANTRFRWRATALGSFVVMLLGWFGFAR
jgi:hypothetical protein